MSIWDILTGNDISSTQSSTRTLSPYMQEAERAVPQAAKPNPFFTALNAVASLVQIYGGAKAAALPGNLRNRNAKMEGIAQIAQGIGGIGAAIGQPRDAYTEALGRRDEQVSDVATRLRGQDIQSAQAGLSATGGLDTSSRGMLAKAGGPDLGPVTEFQVAEATGRMDEYGGPELEAMYKASGLPIPSGTSNLKTPGQDAALKLGLQMISQYSGGVPPEIRQQATQGWIEFAQDRGITESQASFLLGEFMRQYEDPTIAEIRLRAQMEDVSGAGGKGSLAADTRQGLAMIIAGAQRYKMSPEEYAQTFAAEDPAMYAATQKYFKKTGTAFGMDEEEYGQIYYNVLEAAIKNQVSGGGMDLETLVGNAAVVAEQQATMLAGIGEKIQIARKVNADAFEARRLKILEFRQKVDDTLAANPEWDSEMGVTYVLAFNPLLEDIVTYPEVQLAGQVYAEQLRNSQPGPTNLQTISKTLNTPPPSKPTSTKEKPKYDWGPFRFEKAKEGIEKSRTSQLSSKPKKKSIIPPERDTYEAWHRTVQANKRTDRALRKAQKDSANTAQLEADRKRSKAMWNR